MTDAGPVAATAAAAAAATTAATAAAAEKARNAFLRACRLDVEVFKPGNVSCAAPGHGMQAAQFIASAQAAAGPLMATGARVGERVEAAVHASWAAAGCNTNLGIVLLAAPIARAFELASQAGGMAAADTAPQEPPQEPPQASPRASPSAPPQASPPAPSPALAVAADAAAAWRLPATLEAVLADLDVDDARAVYRAIAMANPGGLGSAPAQDVHAEPSLPLRAAMALAAGRDTIARIYRDGYAPLIAEARTVAAATAAAAPPAVLHATVQALYLRLLARWLDSHIVRKHGEAVAQNVMAAAQGFEQRARRGEALADDAGFHLWDAELKAQRINPGTSADLCVAVLMLAALLPTGAAVASAAAPSTRWHGT